MNNRMRLFYIVGAKFIQLTLDNVIFLYIHTVNVMTSSNVPSTIPTIAMVDISIKNNYNKIQSIFNVKGIYLFFLSK